MNEKRIQQVLEIERQAQTIHESAANEAKQLPTQAEQESQALIEKARIEAENEARQMVSKAKSEEESNRILTEADEKVRRMDVIARSNFNRAVQDVLARVTGKE